MQTIEPRDYSYEISSLEKLITTIQSNVYFTITIIVALLALAVGIAGWALAVLAKQWVNKRVNEEIGQIDKRIKQLIKENPNVLYASGSFSPLNDGEIIITGLKDFNSNNILSVEVWTRDGLHLERIVDHNNKEHLSISCPQLNGNSQQVSWAVTWIPTIKLKQN
jgi:hypothetical protein